MGLESRCTVRVEDGSGRRDDPDAKVELEGDALIVRGAARVRVPRADMTDLSVQRGILTVTHTGGTVRLALGDAAEKWRGKLLEGPRSRAQKLGVKPGMLVTLVHVNDPTIGREIVEAGGVLVDEHLREPSAPVDMLLLEVRTGSDLALLAQHTPAIGSGVMWVIHPNGTPDVADTKIFAVADRLGFVYTKVMSFSTGMSAERLSLRKAKA